MEEAISRKAGAQIETVGATAEVDDQIEHAMKSATILDSIMHNVYFDDPVKIAEWTSARHVKKAPKREKPAKSAGKPAEEPEEPSEETEEPTE